MEVTPPPRVSFASAPKPSAAHLIAAPHPYADAVCSPSLAHPPPSGPPRFSLFEASRLCSSLQHTSFSTFFTHLKAEQRCFRCFRCLTVVCFKCQNLGHRGNYCSSHSNSSAISTFACSSHYIDSPYSMLNHLPSLPSTPSTATYTPMRPTASPLCLNPSAHSDIIARTTMFNQSAALHAFMPTWVRGAC